MELKIISSVSAEETQLFSCHDICFIKNSMAPWNSLQKTWEDNVILRGIQNYIAQREAEVCKERFHKSQIPYLFP
jgi:hypothetical protein